MAPVAKGRIASVRRAWCALTSSATSGVGVPPTASRMNRESRWPTALGLERDGEVLIKPFCPPYYRDMEEAVLAFVDYKFAPENGTLHRAAASRWREPAAVQSTIARPSWSKPCWAFTS